AVGNDGTVRAEGSARRIADKKAEPARHRARSAIQIAFLLAAAGAFADETSARHLRRPIYPRFQRKDRAARGRKIQRHPTHTTVRPPPRRIAKTNRQVCRVRAKRISGLIHQRAVVGAVETPRTVVSDRPAGFIHLPERNWSVRKDSRG